MDTPEIILKDSYIAGGEQCYSWSLGKILTVSEVRFEDKAQFWFQRVSGDVSDQIYHLLKQGACPIKINLHSSSMYSIIIDEKDSESLLQEVIKIDLDKLLPGKSY